MGMGNQVQIKLQNNRMKQEKETRMIFLYFLFRRLFSKQNNFSISSADFSLPQFLNFQGICLQILKNSIEELQINLTLILIDMGLRSDI